MAMKITIFDTGSSFTFVMSMEINISVVFYLNAILSNWVLLNFKSVIQHKLLGSFLANSLNCPTNN